MNVVKKTKKAVQKGVGKSEQGLGKAADKTSDAVGKVGDRLSDTSVTTRVKADFSGDGRWLDGPRLGPLGVDQVPGCATELGHDHDCYGKLIVLIILT